MGRTTEGKSSSTATAAPIKLGKVKKANARQINEVTARMVINTLNELDNEYVDLNEVVGQPLVRVRNYIRRHYGFEMTKSRQELIKQIIRNEFSDGRIVMTNSRGELNFRKRFQSAIDDSEIEDEDELGKVKKANARQINEVTTRMVMNTLNALDNEYVDPNGVAGQPLVRIRNYFRRHYGFEMTKDRQKLIKQIIQKEFSDGRIVMTNSKGQLNFTKRFQSAIDDWEIGDKDDEMRDDEE